MFWAILTSTGMEFHLLTTLLLEKLLRTSSLDLVGQMMFMGHELCLVTLPLSLFPTSWNTVQTVFLYV